MKGRIKTPADFNELQEPFDRILVAQASVEGISLATADPIVLRYPGPIISAA